MATNPAGRKGRYCPVEMADPPNQLPQPLRQFETPQLRQIPYRESMTPGKSPTYNPRSAKQDRRKGDL